MNKETIITLSLLLLLAGCSTNQPKNSIKEEQHAIIETSLVPTESIEVVADQLVVPWSIEKNDETFYITERQGSIVKVEKGVTERQQVDLNKELATAAEAGLLGFILAPNFNQSKRAYAYYTYNDESGQFNRIAMLELSGNVWTEERVLLDKIPSGAVHHGGRLKIGPDGKLYATTGDAREASIAQDRNSLGGKILRLNLDGTIPNDNPFPNSYVYSYGHRNPQGITWSTEGELYASEHGNNANDEMNQIEPGQNYGWPIIEGLETQQGMKTPIFTSGHNNTWAPSGMAFYNGKLYVAALRGSAVLEFDLTNQTTREIITGLGRIRDVSIEGDSLYFISNNTDGRGNPQENDDKLYRIPLSQLSERSS